MQAKHRSRRLAAGGVLLVWASMVHAQEAALDLSLPAQTYVQNAREFILATNDTNVLVKRKDTRTNTPVARPDYEPSLWTGRNAHQYLGLATIVTALGAAASAPESGCGEKTVCVNKAARETNGTHAKFAKASVLLAAATIVTGLIVHWDDFYLADGITEPDNLHVLLGVSGAALMAYAVNKSKNSSVPVSHAGIAELGALGMIVAIKLTW